MFLWETNSRSECHLTVSNGGSFLFSFLGWGDFESLGTTGIDLPAVDDSR